MRRKITKEVLYELLKKDWKVRPIIIGTTNHPTFGDHWIIGHGYFTSPVDGNYVIVNNGWGNNNVWIEPSTTYLDGTIHFTN